MAIAWCDCTLVKAHDKPANVGIDRKAVSPVWSRRYAQTRRLPNRESARSLRGALLRILSLQDSGTLWDVDEIPRPQSMKPKRKGVAHASPSTSGNRGIA
jgi:hypothetical protein